jgi:hypothetical protein
VVVTAGGDEVRVMVTRRDDVHCTLRLRIG